MMGPIYISRHRGSEHCFPFEPCPICGTDVWILQDDEYLWQVFCPVCLTSSLEYGSRLDMVYDWNCYVLEEKCKSSWEPES